jgi:hypothetical protein
MTRPWRRPVPVSNPRLSLRRVSLLRVPLEAALRSDILIHNTLRNGRRTMQDPTETRGVAIGLALDEISLGAVR